MGSIERYEHHGWEVAVDSTLKGKHREHCLCFICSLFNPDDREANCPIANVIYSNCVALGLVTPVWECPRFIERG